MIRAQSSYAEALAEARTLLQASPTPALDARVLLEHVSGLSRAEMIAADREILGLLVADAFRNAVERREAGEPVAYITGRQEFFGRSFAVGPGVLIPRPESEMLVEAALGSAPERVLDLGTGSACLLLSVLAETGASGLGIDVSEDALEVAAQNRDALGLSGRAELRRLSFADAADALGPERFDTILANPPYIRADAALPESVAGYEPEGALYAGPDGLDAHRECAVTISRLLEEGGSAFIEIGHDQGTTARDIYADALAGREVRTHVDPAGLARMVAVGPRRGL